jgi:hypothetical protein
VTSLGEFTPMDCLLWAAFLIRDVALILGHIFHGKGYALFFTKNGLGNILSNFLQTYLVTLEEISVG